MSDEDDLDGLEVYVCMVCGHEGHPDKFGKFCPGCGTDLDELEAEMSDLREGNQ